MTIENKARELISSKKEQRLVCRMEELLTGMEKKEKEIKSIKKDMALLESGVELDELSCLRKAQH